MENTEQGKLFVVATPIGNLGDISTRAIETLKSVDMIASEDTRVTKKLLEKFGISTKITSYHKFNEKECSTRILKMIADGSSVALVSDAGTPCISDPGRILINELLNSQVKIIPIPGACAVTAFLSALSKSSEEFKFIGFLPRGENAQSKVFFENKNIDLIFYEAANRLMGTLEAVLKTRGKNVKVAVGRELTKIYEEIKIDTAENLIKHYTTNPLKGEIVAMVYAEEVLDVETADLTAKIQKLKRLNYSDKDISLIISELFDVNKNKVYKLALDSTKADSLNK